VIQRLAFPALRVFCLKHQLLELSFFHRLVLASW
jgi:hypothetical protein